jgi:hypothetical protein
MVALIEPVAGVPGTLHVAEPDPGAGFEPPPPDPEVLEPVLEPLGPVGFFDPHARTVKHKLAHNTRTTREFIWVLQRTLMRWNLISRPRD